MKKKVLSALLCVSMVAAMLVGCGSTASEAPAAETQEAEQQKKHRLQRQKQKIGRAHV